MRTEDDFNEANKRHTMSHPPDHIPDIDSQTPATVKSPKEIKEKEKVSFFLYKDLLTSSFTIYLLNFVIFRCDVKITK